LQTGLTSLAGVTLPLPGSISRVKQIEASKAAATKKVEKAQKASAQKVMTAAAKLKDKDLAIQRLQKDLRDFKRGTAIGVGRAAMSEMTDSGTVERLVTGFTELLKPKLLESCTAACRWGVQRAAQDTLRRDDAALKTSIMAALRPELRSAYLDPLTGAINEMIDVLLRVETVAAVPAEVLALPGYIETHLGPLPGQLLGLEATLNKAETGIRALTDRYMPFEARY
jgi:hypothetical protein